MQRFKNNLINLSFMKRKLPPHIVLPNGQWRFVKRGGVKKKIRRNVTMARKKSYSRKGGLGGFLGGFNDVFVGIAAGAVENIAPPIMGIDGIPTTAVGVFMKNSTLKTLGGVMIGNSIASKFSGNQSSGNGGGY